MKNDNLASRILAIILSLAIVLSATSCARSEDAPATYADLFFDTVINVTLYEYPGSSSAIFDRCRDACSLYESLLSPTDPDSDVWKVNHAKSFPVAISRETADVIAFALEYCELSDGLMDVSAGSLTDLWNVKENASLDSPVIPSDSQIREAVSHVDYSGISLRDGDAAGEVLLTMDDPDSRLDLGSVAKGYVADRLEEVLRESGVTSGIINLGGNVLVIGAKPAGTAFNIGIQQPFGARGETAATVELTDASLVTSGIYERYYESGGRIYHHVIDVRTGYPSDNGAYSATVRTRHSADADALSTICLLLGVDEGIRLIETIPGTEVLYVNDAYELISSSGW